VAAPVRSRLCRDPGTRLTCRPTTSSASRTVAVTAPAGQRRPPGDKCGSALATKPPILGGRRRSAAV